MPGWEAWQAIMDLVKNLSEVMLSTLPGFWKIAKAYMDGKYRKVAPAISLQSPTTQSISIGLISHHLALQHLRGEVLLNVERWHWRL